MSESMREEFEAFKERHSSYLDVFSVETYSNGDYVDTDVQLAWEAWQASRAALCVELPVVADYIDLHRQGMNAKVYSEALTDAIHAAGVKTK